MGTLRAKDEGEPRKPIPAGNYFAIVCGVYDIGTQTGGQYGPKHQIIVQWELHKRKGPMRNEKGDVMTTSNFYGLSFGDLSNLRHDVEAMLGRKFTAAEAKSGYDIEELLGKPCRLQIVHDTKADGKIKDMIGTIMPLDEDDEKPKGEVDEVYFEINLHDLTVPSSVPEWVAKIIRRSSEFIGEKAGTATGGGSSGRQTARVGVGAPMQDDDIPF